MKKVMLLLEGGVAGHLSHLYDNRSLSFNEMKAILHRASEGQLEGTEKTDGFNIYLSARRGIALYARNKGDMTAGGRTLHDLNLRQFAGGEDIKKVYLNSFRAFQKAIDSMSTDEQSAMFGDGDVFYNVEIQGPGASNVVNYDANVLSIHHGGHKRYEPEANKVETISDQEMQQRTMVLDALINRFEQATQNEDFSVRRTAVMQLSKLSDDTALEEALGKIEAAGFSGDMTVGEFLEDGVRSFLRSELAYFDPNLQQMVANQIMDKRDESGKKVVDLRRILKGLRDQEKQEIRTVVKNGPKILSKVISPIEDAIHVFSVEILKGLQSAYILDNRAELQRLKTEVRTAIQNISQYTGPGAQEAHEVLKRQLMKLKNHDNINTTVEGFVFQWGDQLYKFTGNFAPINQLLGLFKYGRGSVPPIKSTPSQHLSEGLKRMAATAPEELYQRLSEKTSIGVFPGGFKPPHKGHLSAAAAMAGAVEVPIIIMGHPTKTNVRTIGGAPVTFESAAQVWQIYANDAGIDLFILEAPPGGNPMHIAYDILQNAQPGQMIYMVAGAKDAKRFANVASQYAPEGVNLNVEPMPNVIDPDTNKAMSATTFREAVEQGLDITKFVPETSAGSIAQIVSVLSPTKNESNTASLIFDLVYEAIDPRSNIPPAEQAAEEIMAGIQGFTPQVMDPIGPAVSDMFKDFGEEQLVPAIGDIVSGASENLAQNVGGTMEELVKLEMEKEKKAKQSQAEESRANTEAAIAKNQSGVMAEISAMGAGAVSGFSGPITDKDEDEENNELIETIMNYLLHNPGDQGAI